MLFKTLFRIFPKFSKIRKIKSFDKFFYFIPEIFIESSKTFFILPLTSTIFHILPRNYEEKNFEKNLSFFYIKKNDKITHITIFQKKIFLKKAKNSTTIIWRKSITKNPENIVKIYLIFE